MMSDLMAMFKNAIKEAKLEHLKQKDEIDWINTDEAKELLNIKSKTKMQQLRSAGEIVFTKYGKKIKYSKKSILEILNKHAKL
ncbi:MAG: helix-turn-helix domain-containing protein [Sphingobacteriaceae bacterium]|nr:helix-turn-helix domain-containing protein [Sphingobacteriaceae bacterium]